MRSSIDGMVGAKLMEHMREINSEIEELRLKRSALRDAWEKWDIAELLRMGFISQSEHDQLKDLHERDSG